MPEGILIDAKLGTDALDIIARQLSQIYHHVFARRLSAPRLESVDDDVSGLEYGAVWWFLRWEVRTRCTLSSTCSKTSSKTAGPDRGSITDGMASAMAYSFGRRDIGGAPPHRTGLAFEIAERDRHGAIRNAA